MILILTYYKKYRAFIRNIRSNYESGYTGRPVRKKNEGSERSNLGLR